VESEYGKGSCFTARIVQDIVPDAGGIGEETAASLRNFHYNVISNVPVEYPQFAKNALVVDDVPANRDVAVKMLDLYGVRSDTAASGGKAIEKIQGTQQPYDIVFMDHMMPEMDGIEATQKLREGGYGGVIVALTASAMRGMKEFYLEQGFDDYLTKPMNFNALGEMLKKWLGTKEKSEDRAVNIAAEIEYRRLDMLNHYRVSFENSKEIDAGYFDRFATLVETWAVSEHHADDVREYAHLLTQAGRQRDVQTIREKLTAFCDMLKERVNETAQQDRRLSLQQYESMLTGEAGEEDHD